MQTEHNGPAVYGVLAFSENKHAPLAFIWAANLEERDEIEAALWVAHSQLVGAFGGWLAGLERRPYTRVLLGSVIRFNERTARSAAQALRRIFGLPEPKRGPRPVCQIGCDGHVRTFPTALAAGEANGVSRPRIARCLTALTMRRFGLWI